MSPATVLVADRSMSVRAVLRRLLEENPEIRVIADSTDGKEALRLAPGLVQAQQALRQAKAEIKFLE